MNPLISEFSYGYALTEELAAGYRNTLRGAPVFPSLIDEGRSGGYDVELPILGAPLFLQFKLSHYLKKSSALEWYHWNRPYFRMHLRPLRHSRQHNLLLSWEEVGNEVYYASPMFYHAEELNAAYSGRMMVESSAFFRPQDIGPLPDVEQHCVVFHPSGTVAYFHSEDERPVQLIHGKEWLERVFFGAKQRMSEVSLEMLNELVTSMHNVLFEAIPGWKRQHRETFDRFARHEKRGLAAYVSYLARTYYDSQFVLISPFDKTTESEQG
ncbi:MAG: hypothetical protein KKG10_08020 [Proteobacteria bacterium]|nr:hypothetical protein [Pseudomonadota bacterium]